MVHYILAKRKLGGGGGDVEGLLLEMYVHKW